MLKKIFPIIILVLALFYLSSSKGCNQGSVEPMRIETIEDKIKISNNKSTLIGDLGSAEIKSILITDVVKNKNNSFSFGFMPLDAADDLRKRYGPDFRNCNSPAASEGKGYLSWMSIFATNENVLSRIAYIRSMRRSPRYHEPAVKMEVIKLKQQNADTDRQNGLIVVRIVERPKYFVKSLEIIEYDFNRKTE